MKLDGHSLFRTGAYILIFIGCSHLIGQLIPIHPMNQTEETLMKLMINYQKPVLGGKMSAMDIQDGFSYCYALFFIYAGFLNLLIFKSQYSNLSKISLLNSIVFSIGTIISLIYFFWLPVISFAVSAGIFFFHFILEKK